VRVPQNIPLCKTITYTGLESFGADNNPVIEGADNEVPIYVEINAKDSSLDSFIGCVVHTDKSYGNYKPPTSYIVPNGYKAVMKYLESTVGYYTKFTSTGLGYVCILGRMNPSEGEGLLVIEIVKE